MPRRVTYELRLTFRNGAAQALEGLDQLVALGVPAGALSEQTVRGRRFVSIYTSSHALARLWQQRIAASGWRGISIRMLRLRETDWSDAWKRHLKPFAVTRRLLVIPAWSPQARQGPGPQRIVLETGMAFGTGKHPTTRWMAGFVEQLRGRFTDVLDIGTGTGILSLVAHRCGAHRIVAVDLEPGAATVARRNLMLNGCTGCTVFRRDFTRKPVPGSFDLILANIGSTELLAMRASMLQAVRPGKYLAISGILRRQLGGFRRQFDTKPLRCLRVCSTHDWAALLYQLTDGPH